MSDEEELQAEALTQDAPAVENDALDNDFDDEEDDGGATGPGAAYVAGGKPAAPSLGKLKKAEDKKMKQYLQRKADREKEAAYFKRRDLWYSQLRDSVAADLSEAQNTFLKAVDDLKAKFVDSFDEEGEDPDSLPPLAPLGAVRAALEEFKSNSQKFDTQLDDRLQSLKEPAIAGLEELLWEKIAVDERMELAAANLTPAMEEAHDLLKATADDLMDEGGDKKKKKKKPKKKKKSKKDQQLDNAETSKQIQDSKDLFSRTMDRLFEDEKKARRSLIEQTTDDVMEKFRIRWLTRHPEVKDEAENIMAEGMAKSDQRVLDLNQESEDRLKREREKLHEANYMKFIFGKPIVTPKEFDVKVPLATTLANSRRETMSAIASITEQINEKIDVGRTQAVRKKIEDLRRTLEVHSQGASSKKRSALKKESKRMEGVYSEEIKEDFDYFKVKYAKDTVKGMKQRFEDMLGFVKTDMDAKDAAASGRRDEVKKIWDEEAEEGEREDEAKREAVREHSEKLKAYRAYLRDLAEFEAKNQEAEKIDGEDQEDEEAAAQAVQSPRGDPPEPVDDPGPAPEGPPAVPARERVWPAVEKRCVDKYMEEIEGAREKWRKENKELYFIRYREEEKEGKFEAPAAPALPVVPTEKGSDEEDEEGGEGEMAVAPTPQPAVAPSNQWDGLIPPEGLTTDDMNGESDGDHEWMEYKKAAYLKELRHDKAEIEKTFVKEEVFDVDTDEWDAINKKREEYTEMLKSRFDERIEAVREALISEYDERKDARTKVNDLLEEKKKLTIKPEDLDNEGDAFVADLVDKLETHRQEVVDMIPVRNFGYTATVKGKVPTLPVARNTLGGHLFRWSRWGRRQEYAGMAMLGSLQLGSEDCGMAKGMAGMGKLRMIITKVVSMVLGFLLCCTCGTLNKIRDKVLHKIHYGPIVAAESSMNAEYDKVQKFLQHRYEKENESYLKRLSDMDETKPRGVLRIRMPKDVPRDDEDTETGTIEEVTPSFGFNRPFWKRHGMDRMCGSDHWWRLPMTLQHAMNQCDHINNRRAWMNEIEEDYMRIVDGINTILDKYEPEKLLDPETADPSSVNPNALIYALADMDEAIESLLQHENEEIMLAKGIKAVMVHEPQEKKLVHYLHKKRKADGQTFINEMAMEVGTIESSIPYLEFRAHGDGEPLDDTHIEMEDHMLQKKYGEEVIKIVLGVEDEPQGGKKKKKKKKKNAVNPLDVALGHDASRSLLQTWISP